MPPPLPPHPSPSLTSPDAAAPLLDVYLVVPTEMQHRHFPLLPQLQHFQRHFPCHVFLMQAPLQELQREYPLIVAYPVCFAFMQGMTKMVEIHALADIFALVAQHHASAFLSLSALHRPAALPAADTSAAQLLPAAIAMSQFALERERRRQQAINHIVLNDLETMFTLPAGVRPRYLFVFHDDPLLLYPGHTLEQDLHRPMTDAREGSKMLSYHLAKLWSLNHVIRLQAVSATVVGSATAPLLRIPCVFVLADDDDDDDRVTDAGQQPHRATDDGGDGGDENDGVGAGVGGRRTGSDSRSRLDSASRPSSPAKMPSHTLQHESMVYGFNDARRWVQEMLLQYQDAFV